MGSTSAVVGDARMWSPTAIVGVSIPAFVVSRLLSRFLVSLSSSRGGGGGGGRRLESTLSTFNTTTGGAGGIRPTTFDEDASAAVVVTAITTAAIGTNATSDTNRTTRRTYRGPARRRHCDSVEQSFMATRISAVAIHSVRSVM
jgi:hypothetical protein